MSDAKAVEAILPVTPVQLGMLFQSQLAPGSGVYIIQLAFDLAGPLDAGAFRRAWEQLVARHPVHRTLFLQLATEKPLQVVLRQVSLPWRQEDWSSLPGSTQDAQFDALMAEERTRGFAPGTAPLMRLVLLRLGEGRHRFLWSRHHAISDGWSLSIVMRELLSLYDAAVRRQPESLPPSRPYRDYVAWLSRKDPVPAERFWRAHLGGLAGPTPLVVDRKVGLGENSSKTKRRSSVTLSREVTRALNALARSELLTLNTLVQCAWALLLGRYSGETSVLFGFIAAGRPPALPGVEAMVGCFLNTLPARVEVNQEAPLLAWLRAQQLLQLEREEHGHVGLSSLRKWAGVSGNVPLFESLFVFENYPLDATLAAGAGGVSIERVRTSEQTSFPLTVLAAPGEELSLHFVYEAARFDPGSIERMLGHYRTLLEGFVALPGAKVRDLPLLTEAEVRTLREQWNATSAPVPAVDGLHRLFEAQARRTPDAVALVDGTREVTYWELDARADVLAQRLRRSGVNAGDLVAVCQPQRADLVASLLGVLKASAAYVPIDPAYPPARIAVILEDSQAKAALAHGSTRALLGAFPGAVIGVDEAPPISGAEAPVEAFEVTPAQPAYVLFTSGSTGRPKGVVLTHANALAFIAWASQAFPAEAFRGTLAATSVCFDLSVFELFAPLSVGGTVLLAENVLALPTLPARDRVTLINSVPSVIDTLMREGPLPASARTVNLAGEPLPRSIVERLHATGTVEQVFNLYGPTECTTYSTFTCVPRDESKPTIGRPIANTTAHVLDARLRHVPVNVPGELYLGGAGVAQGYLHRPELTAERFVADPFAGSDARMYRTGDRVRWLPSGELEYVDRIDRQVKLRGFRIELAEIELSLGRLEGVREAAVVVREDAPGQRRLVGYVAGESGQTLDRARLVAELRSTLPEYMVPSALVVLPSLPLSPNGKLDRAALPVPEVRVNATPAAPSSDTERAIAAVWQELLALPQVGVDDSFFVLGGDSLLLARVHGRLSTLYPGRFTLTDLFKYPTVRALAAQVVPAQEVRPSSFSGVSSRLERRKGAAGPKRSGGNT
jgi:amino acid adenylation domain-containing protein